MYRKIFLFPALCVLAGLSSCSNDDHTTVLNAVSVSLYVNEEFGLEVVKGDKRVEWESEDDFIARVTVDGTVTGAHVGKTVVHSKESQCQVTVEPMYYLYEEPDMSWGASEADIISRNGIPSSRSDNQLIYQNEESASPITVYSFSGGKLNAILSFVGVASGRNLSAFLLERYAIYEYVDDEDLVAVFGDAYDPADAVTYAALFNYGMNYAVLYGHSEDIYSPLKNRVFRNTFYDIVSWF